MSSFLFRLGQRCARHPWRVLGVLLLIAAVVLGANSHLSGSTKDNDEVPGVEAQRADDLLTEHFDQLAGSGGWWLPRWLDRVLPHIDLEGSVDRFVEPLVVGLASAVVGSTATVGAGSDVMCDDVADDHDPDDDADREPTRV